MTQSWLDVSWPANCLILSICLRWLFIFIIRKTTGLCSISLCHTCSPRAWHSGLHCKVPLLPTSYMPLACTHSYTDKRTHGHTDTRTHASGENRAALWGFAVSWRRYNGSFSIWLWNNEERSSEPTEKNSVSNTHKTKKTKTTKRKKKRKSARRERKCNNGFFKVKKKKKKKSSAKSNYRNRRI